MGSEHQDEAPTAAASTPIAQAVLLLDEVPSGRAILDRAERLWSLSSRGDLLRFLKPGRASRTDAVLTRHFNPDTGEETRTRQITVYLREGASIGDTVLDLAHELVHACARPAWDPYDPQLTAGTYIQTAIEGEGGEIAAVAHECRVAREIARSRPQTLGNAAQSRCAAYWMVRGDQIDSTVIQRDFYRVGAWMEKLRARLGREMARFPMLSGSPPKLYSSTGAAPYPVALFEEFQEMTRIACANTRRRVSASAERSVADAQLTAASLAGRSPASSSPSSSGDPTESFLARRCR